MVNHEVISRAPVDVEQARLAALRRYGVLDTPRDESFDRLVRLAARVMQTPIAAIAFVDAERVWFKAAIGVDAVEIPREFALCEQNVSDGLPIFELPDAHAARELAGNPLLQPPIGVRFYAGASLVTPDGFRLGTLCVVDRVPRPGLTPEQRATLVDLASAVMTELERRREHALHERASARLALINDILALAGAATGFVATIEVALARLCRHTGARNGQLWGGDGGGNAPLRALAFAAGGEVSPERRAAFFRAFAEAARSADSRALPADGRTLMVPRVSAAVTAHSSLMQAGYNRGMRAFLLEPLTVGSARYGLVLTFRTPRDDLAEVAELLAEVGQAIRPALHRKQIEDRLALLNDILAEVGGAAGFVAAIEAAMRRLCAHTGAAFAQLWQQVEGASVRLVAFAADADSPPGLREQVFAGFPAVADATDLRPLLAGDAQVMVPLVTEASVAHLPLLHASYAHGMRSYLLHKLPVGAARYALILKFNSERQDLPDVGKLLTEVGQVIRPALLRKQAEERLALLNDVLSVIAGAANFHAAVERAIALLCRHTGALFGLVCEQMEQDATIGLLALAGPGELPGAIRQAVEALFPVPSSASLFAPVLAAGGRLAVPRLSADMLDRYETMRTCHAAGTRSFSAQAFAVAGARLLLVLGFETERGDLDEVADLLGEMVRAIRPAVLRKRAEDRLALITGVLASVAGAADFRAAIEAVLRRLCAHVGAATGLVWQRAEGTEELRLVGVQAVGRAAAALESKIDHAFPVLASQTMLGSLLEAEGQLLMPRLTDAMAEQFSLVRLARETGIRSAVAQSLVVGPRTYVVTISFAAERADLEQVGELIGEVARAIRPALQRRQAEERSALLQAAVDATTDAVVVTDATATATGPAGHRLLQVNPAFTRMTGYRAEEVLGRDMRMLQGPATDPDAVRRLREAVATHRAVRVELLNYRRDGTPFWVEVDIAPFADTSGAVANFVGVLRDTTERRATQEALQRLAAELQDRTGQLTDVTRLARLGAWSWRADRDTMTWSDETYELFGVARGRFVPTVEAFFGLLHAEDAPRAREAGWHALRAGTDLHVEIRVPLSGGRVRTIIWYGSPRRAPDGTPLELRGYCQDVSERRETEAALRHGEKLRALGKLTGGIAHEFNNVLTIVQANLEIALDETASLADARPELEAARHAAAAGTELTGRLLSFARSEPLRNEATDINAWLGPLRDMATRTLGQRYRVSLRADPALPPVAVDRSQLESAVLNLILNARDAMPRGGAITIETECMEVPPGARGTLADLRPGSYAVVAVRDNGAGMPPDVVERAFEPFFTTKPSGSGTGLGLSMVLSFARQSGGTALIETAPGRGTAVRVVLPIA